MKNDILESYLSKFSKTKNSSEKESIVAEIRTMIVSETSEERKEGISSVEKALSLISEKLDSQLQLQH